MSGGDREPRNSQKVVVPLRLTLEDPLLGRGDRERHEDCPEKSLKKTEQDRRRNKAPGYLCFRISRKAIPPRPVEWSVTMWNFLWRHLIIRWRCSILRAQGVKVRRHGRVLVITGGKRVKADSWVRSLPHTARPKNSQRKRPSYGSAAHFATVPPLPLW